ncbi:MAG: MFS transporter [Caulobacteraceae bacterium]|nr:MFS transporter [Caulobacteraceae bacterium]
MRLSNPRLAAYALGAFGTGVFSTVPTVLLLYFCTETLKMPPALAGLAVFLPKVWALVWDPTVGVWSDRTRTPIGRRRPFLLVGAVLVSSAFLALFAWPYATGKGAFTAVALIYFALANAYSLFAVPFVSVPAEISPDPAERERVTAWRIGFAMVGVLIGAGLAPVLVQAGGGGRKGYLFMAMIVAAICGAGMLSAFFATPSRTGVEETRTASLREALPALFGNAPFLKLIAAYVLQLTGIGLVSAIAPYWIVDVAGRSEGQVGLALGFLLLVTIASTPLWALLMRRIGARTTIAASALLYGLATLLFLLLPPHPPTVMTYAVYALIGIPFAGIQVGPFALAAHLIHEASATSGARREGLYTGLWTAGEKLGLALGPGVAGFGLTLVGFRSGAAAQAPQTLHGVNLLMAAGPTVFLWLSLFLLTGRRTPTPVPA